MAKTIEELEQELGKIAEPTRQSYDVLNSKQRSGRYYVGLYRQLDIAKNTLKKKTAFESRKREAEANIASLEPRIKEAEAKYKKFQDQKNAITKEIKDLKSKEVEAKRKDTVNKSAKSIFDKTLDELSTAELSIGGYKGEEKYQDAYRKAEQAYNNAIKSGTNVKPLGSPKIDVPPLPVDGGKGAEDKGLETSESISAFIGTLADPANSAILKQVQQDLASNFGYKGPVDGKYSLTLQTAIDGLAKSRSSLPANLQGSDFRTFLADKASSSLLGVSATGAPGGSGGTSIVNYIADATKAASIVKSAIKGELGREATPKEVQDLSAILIDAQKKNPYKTTNGIRTGGINEEELIRNVINTGAYAGDKKLAKLSTLGKLAIEAVTRKTEGSNIDAQTIRNTARSNLLELSDVQVSNFLKDLKGGQDINTINNRIRSIAAMGMPDSIKKMVADGTDLETIYQPYKTRMAAILELNPQSIDVNDATLRSAIGPDKEMPLYEFEKALRKDSRWQYTTNARDKVSEISARIRRDFGFEA